MLTTVMLKALVLKERKVCSEVDDTRAPRKQRVATPYGIFATNSTALLFKGIWQWFSTGGKRTTREWYTIDLCWYRQGRLTEFI